tara:strand:- start:129 stop:1733 length:1605 start_codon:yes stop_codon:yes gene_type:complete
MPARLAYQTKDLDPKTDIADGALQVEQALMQNVRERDDQEEMLLDVRNCCQSDAMPTYMLKKNRCMGRVTIASLLWGCNLFAMLVHLTFAIIVLASTAGPPPVSDLDQSRAAEFEQYKQSAREAYALTNGYNLDLDKGTCVIDRSCPVALPVYKFRLLFCGLIAPDAEATAIIDECDGPSAQPITALKSKRFEKICLDELAPMIADCTNTSSYSVFRNRTLINLFAFRWDLYPSFDTDLPAVAATKYAQLASPVLMPSRGPDYVDLRLLASFFFFCSALAHAFLLAGCRYAFYYEWLDEARNPARWVEYFVSSSIMIFVIAYFSGIREGRLLMAIVTLQATTITFGWVTEALSRPEFTTRVDGYIKNVGGPQRVRLAPPQEWAIHVKRPETIVFGRVVLWLMQEKGRMRSLSKQLAYAIVALQRLGPSLLGWLPYLLMWSFIIETFTYSVDAASEDFGPPDFVTYIVWGQFVVFSLFAFTQVFQQSSDFGLRYYWIGELSYLILSMTAKIILGSLLIFNILAFSGGLARLTEEM